MAQITGSSTTDWSGISLPQGNFETDIVQFFNRTNQVNDEVNNGQYALIVRSPTLVVDPVSGGRARVGGSGFDTDNPIINSFNFKNPPDGTGEVLGFTGTLDLIGNDVLTSVTIGSTGFSETFKGTIIVPPTFPAGNFSGTLTSLVVKIGAATETLTGNFHLTGDLLNASLTGTVTGLSVGSGANVIKMSGLSLSLDVLQAALASPELEKVDDLFAFLSNHLPGNDTITYTNNSGVGMAFFGGDGNDTITISGPNAETLNGGGGNDTLTAGAGDDTLLGGDGNDVFLIGSASDHGVGEVIDGGAGSDVIRFTSTSAGGTLVVAPGVTTVESVVIGTAAGVMTGLTALNVDASAVGSGLFLTGNNGANQITGSAFADTLTGNAGNDILTGGAGNDTLTGGAGADILHGDAGDDLILLASTAEFAAGEHIDGGADTDTLRLTSTVAGTLTLTANVTTIEQVDLATAAGDPTGIAAINVNAAAVTNSLTLVGNNGANVLTGTAQADRLSGNDGNDTLTGGAGDDTLLGGDGNDVFLIGSAADHGVDEVIDGGAGSDVIRFTSTSAGGILVVAPGVTTVESVVIGTAAGITTGLTALNVDASVVGSGLFLTGNNGANTLTGTGFDDGLTGNAGNDILTGGAGNDTLTGGSGQDTVDGGAGKDQVTMLVTAGNVDTIDAGADTDTLLLSGVVPGNHVAVVDLASLIDQVVSIGGVADALTQINFENLDASGIGSSVTVTGSGGDNIIIGSNGKDTLIGGAGNDTLTGGAGADNLQGGAGDDLILLASMAEFAAGEHIDGGADTDTLRLTSTVAGTLTLTANVTTIERVELATAAGLTTGLAALNVNAVAVANSLTLLGNNGANVLTGTGQADTINGNGGNDTLNGGAGDDTLEGGTGVDTLRGGLGNDTYQVNRGDGQDTISENDGTLSNSDTLLYGATINPLDLVLSRQANDLRLAIHGSTDRVTVQNWFSTPDTAQVETLQAGNGQTLLSTQVDQLIQAMAGFIQQTGLRWDAASGGGGTAPQQAQFQGIIAANWQ